MTDTKTESPTGVPVQRFVRRSHFLKTWPVYFDALWDGQKTFEIRKNDRDYQVGDRLVLQEYDPERVAYLDREIHADVSYRMPGGRWGVAEDYCVMALRIVTKRWKQTPNDQDHRPLLEAGSGCESKLPKNQQCQNCSAGQWFGASAC